MNFGNWVSLTNGTPVNLTTTPALIGTTKNGPNASQLALELTIVLGTALAIELIYRDGDADAIQTQRSLSTTNTIQPIIDRVTPADYIALFAGSKPALMAPTYGPSTKVYARTVSGTATLELRYRIVTDE